MKKVLYFLSFTALTLAACQGKEQAFLMPAEDVKAKTDKVEKSFTVQFADNADTRTQLAEGNKVKWIAGDQIAVIPAEGESIYTANTAVFTADKDGFSVNITGSVVETPEYYALYPSSAATDGYYPISGSQKAFGLTIPAQQIAMPNTFAENLNLGYAHSTTQNLSFKNVNALIKFRLTGSAVSNLSKIRIYPTASMGVTPDLSGELLVDTSNGEYLGMNGAGGNVELTGDFLANSTYYIVSAPASLPQGFSMSFIDKDGKE